MKRKQKISTAAKVLFILFSIYAAVRLVSQEIEINQKAADNNEIQKQLNAQLITNNQISENIENAGSNEFYEQIAREKLGYIRPGERIFVDAGT